MNFHQCRPAHTICLPTLSLSRHNGTTIRGREGTTHTAAHSRHCSLCAVLGSGRHNSTLMRRNQRVAGEAWRVHATSGVGASEPALPRSLRCDLVLCCCVMSYSVLVLSTTVAIPQRCRRILHRHPRRTVAGATAAAAAAAVRWLLCFGCGWCLLRLFVKKLIKNWLFCCCGDDHGDRARPSCCAASLNWRGHRHRRPRRFGCGCGCGAATAVLLLPSFYSHSLVRVFQKCFAFVAAGHRYCCVDSVHVTGWRVFYLHVFFSWKFYHKLSQMHAEVNLAFFKPDGRVFSVFF